MSIVKNSISAYWWKGKPNWGDLLTPLLLKKFTETEGIWASPNEAKLACVGSILGNLIKPSFTGIILGSGKLFEKDSVPQKANILGLRGPLTAKGVKGDYILGDPGLIANELVNIKEKKYNLGLISHWSDDKLSKNPEFLKYNPVIIKSSDNPLKVIKQIGQCKKIVSSSLHGIILADAFSIPRRFEASANWDNEGHLFKMHDYNKSVGIETLIGKVQEANWNKVNDLKNGLFDAFKLLQGMIENE